MQLPQLSHSSATLHLARIEVGPAEMREVPGERPSPKVAEALKQIGYAHVTLDLQGYRRGSTNEVLPARGRARRPCRAAKRPAERRNGPVFG